MMRIGEYSFIKLINFLIILTSFKSLAISKNKSIGDIFIVYAKNIATGGASSGDGERL